jgi:hypothetical protein
MKTEERSRADPASVAALKEFLNEGYTSTKTTINSPYLQPPPTTGISKTFKKILWGDEESDNEDSEALVDKKKKKEAAPIKGEKEKVKCKQVQPPSLPPPETVRPPSHTSPLASWGLLEQDPPPPPHLPP